MLDLFDEAKESKGRRIDRENGQSSSRSKG